METLIASQEKQTPPVAKKSSSMAFSLSLILFLIVLVGTIGLKVYTFALDNKLDDLNNKITETENTISETKQKNPEVNAYSLWSKAKDSIETQIQKSQAQRYLAQVDTIARNFYRKVSFSGFNYSDGKVQTSAVAFGSSIDAALNIVELLRNYRGEPKTPDSIFGLEPVLSVSGDSSRREFSVVFDIKNTPIIQQTGATNTGTVLPEITATGTLK